jgi:YidC/Oxa1 family membrane protein insertase
MLDIIAKPLGQFLYWIYGGVNNYGIAIIIFTIIVRAALVPLTLKQYKSSAEMQKVQPLLQEIQRKYANDKEKLNQETMKLYQDHKINPAGGCLPLIIQMPILLALWQVITKPLQYMLRFTPETLTKLATEAGAKGSYPQIETITYFINQGKGDQVGNLNMFFPSHSGLNLASIPTWHPSAIIDDPSKILLLILPLLAVATTYITARMSMPKQSENDKNKNPMGNSLLYVSPLMTLIFSFQFPLGMSLYWFAGNIFAIGQQYYVNKYVLKKKEVVNK